MDSKSYTILIASNRHGGTHRLTLTSAWVKTLTLLGFLLTLLAITATLDYFGLLLKVNENGRLRNENLALKGQVQMAEEKLSAIEARLDRIHDLTRKLNLISQGDGGDRATQLALSPASQAGSPEEMRALAGGGVRRMPSSAFLPPEPRFADLPVADEKSGELAVQRDAFGREASGGGNTIALSVRIDRAMRESQLREQGVSELWQSLSKRESLWKATPSIKPSWGWFTSRFGYRVDPVTNRPEMHAGLDMAAPVGTPVYAPADGVVSFVGYDGGYGKLVSIDHGFGVTTRYGHTSRVFVEQGQKVSRWDVIAAVGSTGKSTGSHLHYEVRIHGIPVDPINYILSE